MNTTWIRGSGLALAALMLVAGCALASEHKSGGKNGPANLGPKGREVLNNGQRYVLLPEVRAVQSAVPSSDPEVQLAAMGVAAEAVVGKKAQMILYRPRAKGRSPRGFAKAMDADSGKETYPVVQNTRTGVLGVVTGDIQVKLTDTGQASALGRQLGLKVHRVYPAIGYVFYKAGEGQDPFAAAESLKSAAGVESASVEILEHVNIPH